MNPLAQDALNMIKGHPEPAELVTSHPHHGVPHDIWVMATRAPLAPPSSRREGQGLAVKSTIVLEVANDPVHGVYRPQKGLHVIHMKEHIGDTENQRFTVSAILFEDTGAYRLEVTR